MTPPSPTHTPGTPRSNDGHDRDRQPAGSRSRSADEIADLYADVADSLGRWSWMDRLVTGRYRERQFGDASGRVLDVACGTGTNFPYLPASADLVGIDISEAMLGHARAELDRLSLDGSLRRMDAGDLAFDDDSFDTVVSALSTCTFPAPVAALHEMERVCRPDGRILLLEHGRSSVGPLARMQDWRADAHYEKRGCRWNQEPVELVAAAGLPVLDSWTAFLGIVTGIETAPR
jgi:ubiquinone/menaquinone biosynthesis C-methylase UbiE